MNTTSITDLSFLLESNNGKEILTKKINAIESNVNEILKIICTILHYTTQIKLNNMGQQNYHYQQIIGQKFIDLKKCCMNEELYNHCHFVIINEIVNFVSKSLDQIFAYNQKLKFQSQQMYEIDRSENKIMQEQNSFFKQYIMNLKNINDSENFVFIEFIKNITMFGDSMSLNYLKNKYKNDQKLSQFLNQLTRITNCTKIRNDKIVNDLDVKEVNLYFVVKEKIESLLLIEPKHIITIVRFCSGSEKQLTIPNLNNRIKQQNSQVYKYLNLMLKTPNTDNVYIQLPVYLMQKEETNALSKFFRFKEAKKKDETYSMKIYCALYIKTQNFNNFSNSISGPYAQNFNNFQNMFNRQPNNYGHSTMNNNNNNNSFDNRSLNLIRPLHQQTKLPLPQSQLNYQNIPSNNLNIQQTPLNFTNNLNSQQYPNNALLQPNHYNNKSILGNANYQNCMNSRAGTPFNFNQQYQTPHTSAIMRNRNNNGNNQTQFKEFGNNVNIPNQFLMNDNNIGMYQKNQSHVMDANYPPQYNNEMKQNSKHNIYSLCLYLLTSFISIGSFIVLFLTILNIFGN
jgi:hypothetical protein